MRWTGNDSALKTISPSLGETSAMTKAAEEGERTRSSQHVSQRRGWMVATVMGLLVGMASVPPVHADETPLAITETRTPMSRGTQPALVVTIPGAQIKDVNAAWKNELKGYKAKVKEEKNEIFADNALVKAIGDNTIDLYTRLTETKEGVLMQLFVDLGGAFMASNTHPEQYKAAENIVYQFAVAQTKVAIGQQVVIAQKTLEKLQKDQKKLEGDGKALEREIEKDREQIKGLEAQIQDAQKLIEENKKAQGTSQAQVDQQKAMIEGLIQKQKEVH